MLRNLKEIKHYLVLMQLQFFNIPATTSDVAIKESTMLACRIPLSLIALEARRHKQVAMPSITAPVNIGT